MYKNNISVYLFYSPNIKTIDRIDKLIKNKLVWIKGPGILRINFFINVIFKYFINYLAFVLYVIFNFKILLIIYSVYKTSILHYVQNILTAVKV